MSKSGEQVSRGRRGDALQFAIPPDHERRIRGAGLQLDLQGRQWAAHVWKSISDGHGYRPRVDAADVRLRVSRDLAQQSPAGIPRLKSIDEHGSGCRQPSRKRSGLAGLQGLGETARGSQDGELRMTCRQRSYLVPVRFADCQRRPWNSEKIEDFR